MQSKQSKSTILNRDISWMYFNRRILDEAANPSNPLLERLFFLGIYSSNLDEFFRVRVATLRRMVELDERTGSPQKQVKRVLKAVLKLNETYSDCFEKIFNDLITALRGENVFIVDENQLNAEQTEFVETFYKEELMNSLYPVLGSRTSGPELNDKSIYLAVKLTQTEGKSKKTKKEFALIEVPTAEFSRFLVIPKDNGKNCIMFLEDVIRFCLPRIFSPLKYDKYQGFIIKFTRDAEMDIEDSPYQGVLDKVSKGIKSRKSGSAIRLVYDRDIPSDLLRFTEKHLKIDKDDAHVGGARYHNLKDLIAFPNIKRPDLKFEPQPPVAVHNFDEAKSIISLIRQKDQYLHYPYHNFDYFIRLLRESAINPEVKEIKISIYRLAKNSKVIKALICAAMNGKKVTAMVELLARFDESSNINWAKKMQEAGIKVIFGVDGLKVHSKIAHISSRNGSIACIGTGNFHEGTAAVYTDFTLLTAYKPIVDEVASVFEFLEQPYLNPTFNELIVSPQHMRKRILALIKTEIENARKGKPAYIFCKINHIVDEKIIDKLYLAAQAGVAIKLLVRGNCSIVNDDKEKCDNLLTLGIIDRYLEHSRILIFANGGDEKYYIGSADWMQRNLDSRVEVYVPVYDPELQKQLKTVIEYGLKDNVKARIVDGSGRNLLNDTGSEMAFQSQVELYQFYKTKYESDVNNSSVV